MKKQEVCGEAEAACICIKKKRHRGFHECLCKGSWKLSGKKFEVKRFPQPIL